VPFEVVSAASRGIGVLYGLVIVEGKGQFWEVNVGRHIVTNGDSDALFPNYFGGGLVI